MTPKQRVQIGALPPLYNFVLNPYPDERLRRCPFCGGKMGQRKLPLLIHIDPKHLIALNYTNRYCSVCDLLVAHKHEIEHLLTALFAQRAPSVIGNDYLIFGTLEKSSWRQGVEHPQGLEAALAQAHDFKEVYRELRRRQSGWFPEGQEPPIMKPPPSKEWVRVR